MSKTVKKTVSATSATFADAVKIREKAENLIAQSAAALDEFQAKAWKVLESKGQVRQVEYKDKDGTVLGTGPSAVGEGVFNGRSFSFFSRWNRDKGTPTLVFKGLFDSGKTKAERTIVEF